MAFDLGRRSLDRWLLPGLWLSRPDRRNEGRERGRGPLPAELQSDARTRKEDATLAEIASHILVDENAANQLGTAGRLRDLTTVPRPGAARLASLRALRYRQTALRECDARLDRGKQHGNPGKFSHARRHSTPRVENL